MKKLTIYSEAAYLLANLLLALAVSILTAADLGISMIVAPAYLLSEKVSFLTFGQSEYVLQAVVFVLLCVLLKRIKFVYFFSFGTCLLYGWVLDLWRATVPLLNPAITEPGSMGWPLRIGMFVFGMVLTAFSVALFFETYLYPQVYDFFVRSISAHFSIPLARFKTAFDVALLLISVGLSLLFFGKLVGVGIGTVIMALFNGFIIGGFCRWLETCCTIVPLFPRLAKQFEV